ncbi:MAG: hypothetical protein AB1391_02935 [Candidatus Micrarchaeota archaeon]
MVKAFIFSMDAFIAFTLILTVLHSLIFLASIPQSYYSGLMQANYFARDALSSIAHANASRIFDDPMLENTTLLDYIMQKYSTNPSEAKNIIQNHVGSVIPNEYGYVLELWDSKNEKWESIYNTNDTKDALSDTHNKKYHKLRASSHSLFFGYIDSTTGFSNPFSYRTCRGSDRTACDLPKSDYSPGTATLGLVRLVVYR